MSRYRALTTAALCGVALAATAACNGPWNTLQDGLRQNTTITEVHITGGSGNVSVTGDDTVGVDARRTVRYLHTAPGQTMSVSGSVLTLKTECGALCDVSYDVRVGKGVKVTGDNDSGNITLRGVSDVDVSVKSGNVRVDGATGAVKVKADSGGIELSDIAGNVDASVDSGNIDGTDLRGEQGVMSADSGNITLTLPGTGSLTARADSGNISVKVPDNCCQIAASASSGSEHVDVGVNAQSAHKLDLHTDSGNVTVRRAA